MFPPLFCLSVAAISAHTKKEFDDFCNEVHVEKHSKGA